MGSGLVVHDLSVDYDAARQHNYRRPLCISHGAWISNRRRKRVRRAGNNFVNRGEINITLERDQTVLDRGRLRTWASRRFAQFRCVVNAEGLGSIRQNVIDRFAFWVETAKKRKSYRSLSVCEIHSKSALDENMITCFEFRGRLRIVRGTMTLPGFKGTQLVSFRLRLSGCNRWCTEREQQQHRFPPHILSPLSLNDFLTLNSCQFLQAIGVTSAREGYIDTKKIITHTIYVRRRN